MSTEKSFGWRQNNQENWSEFSIKEFAEKVYLVNNEGEVIEVTSKGSLAFLALGHLGYEAWQKAKTISKLDV